jgi:hypothetical protein
MVLTTPSWWWGGVGLAVAALTVGMGAATASGQERGAAFGLKAGVTLASFRGDAAALSDGSREFFPGNRVGFVGGAFVALPMGPRVLLQPEVVYTQKGAQYSGEPGRETWQAEYLEIPLLLKLLLGSGPARPALFAGPAAGFKIDAKVVGRSPGGEEDENSAIGDAVRSVDWGLVFGAGVDIAAGDGTLTLEGRYARGLSPLAKDPERPVQTRSTFDPKHGVLSLQVGYAF